MFYLVIRVAYKQEIIYHLTIKKLTGVKNLPKRKAFQVRLEDCNELELIKLDIQHKWHPNLS